MKKEITKKPSKDSFLEPKRKKRGGRIKRRNLRAPHLYKGIELLAMATQNLKARRDPITSECDFDFVLLAPFHNIREPGRFLSVRFIIN